MIYPMECFYIADKPLRLKCLCICRRRRRIVPQIQRWVVRCSCKPSALTEFRLQLCRSYNWWLETRQMHGSTPCCLSVR